MRVKNSLTSDLFSILDKSNKSDSAKNGAFGSYLDDLLNRSMQTNTPLMGITQSSLFPSPGPDAVSIPNTPYNREESPVTTQTSWRDSADYEEFRNNVLNTKKDSHNLAGRVEKCQPMTPESIDEARQRYDAAWDHLNDYGHTVLVDGGVEFAGHLGTRNDGYMGEDGLVAFHALTQYGGDPDSGMHKQYVDIMNRTDKGDNITVMVEEVKFYGAIVNLADKNEAFAKAYEADPTAAVEEYGHELGLEMNTVQPPYVHTIPNDWAQKVYRDEQWKNASLGRTNIFQ